MGFYRAKKGKQCITVFAETKEQAAKQLREGEKIFSVLNRKPKQRSKHGKNI